MIGEATKLGMTLEVREHISKMASLITGARRYNWKGGVWALQVYPREFAERKYLIKERDGYICQKCFNPFSNNLDVHHRDGDGFHNEDTNLITLCRSCHKLAEANLRRRRG